jgi:hypothetical protein
MTRTIFVAAALALAATLPAAPAQAAGAPRTFVSAAGNDSNNCTNVATPCRHMAAAYAATAANGEIYVLDPANYGSLTITGPVSIEGHGWASIAPVSFGNAITINANPGDNINIIGVVLDGTALSGTNGIIFNSGGSLTVRDSVIRNFANYGILFQPGAASQLIVSNALVSDNGLDGILIQPAASSQITVSNTTISNDGFSGIQFQCSGSSGTVVGALDHVEMVSETNGLYVSSSAQTVNVTVSDSVIANNITGIQENPGGGPTNILVRNSTIANNNEGLFVAGGGSMWVTRSAITENTTGWVIGGGGGMVTSYNDNNIIDNVNGDVAPPQIGYK